jgi:hypothetical protein
MFPVICRDKRKLQIPMHPKNFRKCPVHSPGDAYLRLTSRNLLRYSVLGIALWCLFCAGRAQFCAGSSVELPS